ncbi:putative receptor protein kinase ZmPK1 [Trifolium pratense]|uniref:putative receptor protein kinase ZmPK1 n=1 Tax=Trifolium pratense TaxID=57577 RepID=UPI001E695BDE|nr:putative receptor protein kinase ZmPK1 [Trifolium pratense]
MQIQVFLLFLLFTKTISLTSTTDTLPQGSSLSVEKPNDILISSNGDYSAGFIQVGDNAFCFSVYFTKSKQPTVVWMANRDQPVNGKNSKLSLFNNGNLILTDAERKRTPIWSISTFSPFPLQLQLQNNGNLVLETLQKTEKNTNVTIIWQSFDFPTDTLLPGQELTEHSSLVSSKSKTNFSSGFYKLYFDNDNALRLLFKGPLLASVYWPSPWKLPIDMGRSTYNATKIALLDSFGHFTSSDTYQFHTTDYPNKFHRLLKMDHDGNLRVYSFNEKMKTWEVTWQATQEPCEVHGICGENSMCSYDHVIGRTCFCLKGYKLKNPHDWSQGCEPEFKPADLSCNRGVSFGFLRLQNTEFFGYDLNVTKVTSLKQCQDLCLGLCERCKGFQFKFNRESTYDCFTKTLLVNGRDSHNIDGDVFLKLPKNTLLSSTMPLKHLPLNCSIDLSQPLNRLYEKPSKNSTLSFLVWFALGFGVFEITMIFIVWFFLFRTNKNNDNVDQVQRHLLSATGFQKFSYSELKTATKGFTKEIGRGGGGIVYKGILDDDRVAAVKCLNEAHQGEAEFLAEISTIGMLNHMNLIDMWGYCVERKHRILVYEYMEHGSLAENLCSNSLDWNKRFNVAIGTAKGLAYLHEECLEWVLHCDVKPHNILLDTKFQPKVADFGLSKLLNRDDRDSSVFSRIRGTRGYMAPEWVYNLKITSKVDVYSYGIVLLEMVSGKSPMEIHSLDNSGGIEHHRMVTWVMEKVKNAPTTMFWIEEIVDGNLEGKYDVNQVENLVKVALKCVKDDMNERPSMSQVVEMLLESNERRGTPR